MRQQLLRRASGELREVGLECERGEFAQATFSERGKQVVILREIAQAKTDLQPSAEMVEITACRLLLVNRLGPLTKGQVMTPDVFDGIVDLVKKQKRRVARDRLKDHEAWRGEGQEK